MATNWFTGGSSRSSWFSGNSGYTSWRAMKERQAKEMEQEQVKADAAAALAGGGGEQHASKLHSVLHALGTAGTAVGRGIARGTVELGFSITHPSPATESFKKGSIAAKILGDEPLKNIEAKVSNTNKKHGALAAAGEGLWSVASDVAVPGATKAAKVVTDIVRGTKTAEETARTAKTVRDINEARKFGVKGDVGRVATGSRASIYTPARMIESTSAKLTRRMNELEREKQGILKDPNAYSTSSSELTALKGEPAANVKLTKAGDIKKSSSTKAPVFASTSGKTVTSTEYSANRLRAINREQDELRTQLDHIAKSKPLVSDSTIKPPTKVPKTPREPGDTTFKPDKAEGLRSRLTNQLISTTGLLKRHGAEGKALATGVEKYNRTARDLSTDWFNRLPTYRKLSKGEASNFARASQGLEQAKNAKVEKAVSEWKALAPEIRSQFIKHSGEEIGNIENFFPHSIKAEYLKRGSKGFNAAVKHLVDSGQVKTSGEAVNVLNFARRSNIKGNVLGSFRFSRDYQLPEHMYDTSKTAIANYLEGAAHSVAGAKELGMDRSGIFHTANDLIGKVADRGGNADQVKKTFEQAMGLAQHSETAAKISNTARSVQIFTKLGLGAITNAGQTVNTIIKNGFIDTVKGLGYLSTKQGRQFARESGAFTHGLINDLRELRGITGKSGKIGAPFFQNVEQFNRYLAASAGKFHAERLANRAGGKGLGRLGGKFQAQAEKELRNVGVEGKISGTLSREQKLRAARGSSDTTQFVVAPHTLPGWASSPIGKIVSQFQTFSYKQSGFVWNEIIKPLNKGNALPLARLIAVLPVGYGLYEAKAKIRGSDTSSSNKVIEAWKAAGGGGTVENLVSGTINAKKYSGSGKEFAANEIANLGGPSAGTLMDTLGSVYGLASGKTDAAKKQGLSLVPIVGSRLKNTYAPSGSETGRNIRANAPVNKELGRLGYRLQDTSHKTGRASKLNDSDYKRFIDGSARLFSQRASQALTDPEYMSLSDEDKKNTLSNILSQSRTDILDILVGKTERSSTPKYKSYR